MGFLRSLTTVAVCLLCTSASGVFGAVGVDPDCLSEAVAEADGKGSIADAVANAVADTLTFAINCETGELADGTDQLAFSLAVAISQGTKNNSCSAVADADASPVGRALGEEVREGVQNADADESLDTLLNASGVALEESVLDRFDKTVADPTEDLGQSIADEILVAVTDILKAVTCGDNVEPSDAECVFLSGRFIGDCFPDPEARAARPSSTPSDSDCRFSLGRFIGTNCPP